jgi:hypothetical protein
VCMCVCVSSPLQQCYRLAIGSTVLLFLNSGGKSLTGPAERLCCTARRAHSAQISARSDSLSFLACEATTRLEAVAGACWLEATWELENHSCRPLG